jgi:hypothetical protein
MAFFRRKHLVRKVVVGVVVLGAVAAVLLWNRRVADYVPGEGAEGLVDALGRELPDDGPSVRFSDVTLGAGIDFQHFPGVRTNRIPEDMGSGVALGDADGDGWTDVFLVNATPLDGASSPGAGRCALLRNRSDGSFEDVTAEAGLELERLGMAAAFLDPDSDGDLDLLVSSYGGLDYFRNEDGLRFVDATEEAGLAGYEGFWTGLAVGDYDRDGAVDVYVCGYVHYDESLGASEPSAMGHGADIPVLLNPSTFTPQANLLFHNLGDGTFEEVAVAAGVANEPGRSLGATFADFSGDGWPDLYVANDVSDNALFVNDGRGGFADQTSAAMVGDYRGAMGLAVGDVDGDLDLDFFVTHWVAQENALYTNLTQESRGAGPLGFQDTSHRCGLGYPALSLVGWATRFFDYDNDGLQDLFVVNGSTIPTDEDPTALTPMRSHLYWNAGPKRGFFEVGSISGEFFEEEHVGRGGATFDYDLDGDEDLLVTVHGDHARLLSNEGGNRHRSLRVRLRQPSGNRFALGAELRVDVGERTAMDAVGTQGSYLSQHAVGELAFGLGDATAVDQLVVTWPDGRLERAGPVPADCLVTWERGRKPRVELLPGKRQMALSGPSELDERRRFFDVLQEAGELRVAGENERAVEAYRTALAAWPTHEDALYNLGNCLLALDRREPALDAYRELVLFHPMSSRGWMQIGQVMLDPEARDLDQAEEAFARSHEINGEESLPLVRLGLIALLRDELDRADELLADAGVLNARSVESRYLRGRIAWLRGREVEARAFLAEAHELARETGGGGSVSNEGDTRSGGALVAPELGEAGRAEADFERWKTLLERPVDPGAEYGAREG